MASDRDLDSKEGGPDFDLKDHVPVVNTITYEEAMHHEIEYARSMKMGTSRFSASSRFRHANHATLHQFATKGSECHESLKKGMLEPSIDSRLWRASPQTSLDCQPLSASEFAFRAPGYQGALNNGMLKPTIDAGGLLASSKQPFRGFQDGRLLLRQNHDRQDSPHKKYHEASLHRAQHDRSSSTPTLYQQHSQQKDQQPIQKESFDKKHLPVRFHEHPSSNLKEHIQEKKHRIIAMRKESENEKHVPMHIQDPSANKTALACWNTCKGPCTIPLNFEQQRQGTSPKSFSMQTESKDQEPLPTHFIQEDPSSRKNAYAWCDLCQVPCMNPLNVEQHCQGAKHKAKLEEVFGSKKDGSENQFVCYECNVSCINEVSLAQHRIGKKHAARLAELRHRVS